MANSENKEEVMQDEPKKTAKTATASKKKSRLQGLKAEFRRIIWPDKTWWTGVKAEFSRIIWPDKETITKETTAVVVSTVILGIIIALLDLLIKTGLDKVFQIG